MIDSGDPLRPDAQRPESLDRARDSWRQARPDTAARNPNSTSARLVWFLIALSILLIIRFVVPYFAEQIQYSITRGKQRAEYDAAGNALESLKLDQISRAYQLVSQRVAPSVVNINVASVVEVPRSDDLAALFGSGLRQAQGQGSGVVVDKEGYILTNNHVVADATEIQVVLSDGQVVNAEIVGLDPLTDLALLKIKSKDLTPAEWGNSDELEVGALVWAIGSPFGLERSITAGILSGKNRQGLAGSVYHDFLQTDAAVNPGNSGGPLVDARGRVVGINTAIYGDVYQGISFAIPANEAREVYDRLRAEGRVARGWLGVELQTLDADPTNRARTNAQDGVLIVRVAPNSPAENAGLQPGDIIVKWDGKPVDSSTLLTRLIARTAIGSTVEVMVQRGNQTLNLTVKIAPRQ